MTIGLINPTVLGTAGPTFATMQNTEMTAIDTHDHSSGKGNTISLGGSNNGATVAGDVSFTGFGPINQSYSRFAQVSSPGLNATLYVLTGASGDLYYRNAAGNVIALTSGAAIAGSAGVSNTGIWDFGGSGYAGQAKFGYDQGKLQYRAGGAGNADFNATGSNAATIAAAGFWTATTGAFPVRMGLLNSWDGAGVNDRPQGGFGFDIASGLGGGYSLVVGADPAVAGSYSTYDAMRLDPLTTVTGGIYSYGLRINSGLKGQTYEGTFAGMFFTAPVAANSTVHNTLQIGTNIDVASGGTPGTGFGARVLFSNPVSAAAGYTQVSTGAIDGAWVGTVGTNGGFYIHGATSGTVTGTAGFQLMGSGGSDYVGISGTPDASFPLKVYGATKITGAITADSTLNVTGTTTLGVTNTGALAAAAIAGTTYVGSSTATATSFIPTTGPATGAAYTVNQSTVPYAWANCTSGGSISRSYNIDSLASHASTGVFVYNLHATVATTAAVVATCNDSELRTATAVISGGGATVTIKTVTSTTGAAIDAGHNFIIIGA